MVCKSYDFTFNTPHLLKGIIHPGSEQFLNEKELFGYYYIDPRDVYYLPM